MRKTVFVVGTTLVVIASVYFVAGLLVDAAMPKIVSTQVLSMPDVMTTASPTPFQPEMEETAVIVPVPIATAMVKDFVFRESVDLSSGVPVALTVQLTDGGLLSSNWAGAIPFKDTDRQDTVFQPYQGVIYSYLGDVTTSWAHSGINKYTQQRYFATNLELFIRKSDEGSVLSFAEGKTKTESLIGQTAVLCQDELGSVEPLMEFDATAPCPGKQIKLEVVALVIVPREKVVEYDAVVTELNGWLMTNYPDAGFDQLRSDNGWLIRFCIGKFTNQKSDGTPSYLYNRGVIGFRVLDGE